MAAATSRSKEDARSCYRCDGPLADGHQIRLTVAHQGVHADRFSGVNRQICLDCLAAIGLLEFAVDDAESNETPVSLWKDRLAPVRALRGGD